MTSQKFFKLLRPQLRFFTAKDFNKEHAKNMFTHALRNSSSDPDTNYYFLLLVHIQKQYHTGVSLEDPTMLPKYKETSSRCPMPKFTSTVCSNCRQPE